jgi:hypothetical protein
MNRRQLKMMTIGWATAVLLTLQPGGTFADPSGGLVTELKAGPSATADVTLDSANATLTQTSDTAWTLDKVGDLNATNGTVTWTITATAGATVGGHLVINGTMTVSNSGSGGATIGNIVANLQTKSRHNWTTVSSDVADATQGDNATLAHIYSGASSEGLDTFSENTASGKLLFMDASTNTIFSLVPQKTIGAGETVTLLFSAAFDNNLLNLPVGTPVRAEIIVSFGNATASGASASNIDINGNGLIDTDEAHRSAACRRASGSRSPRRQTVT